MKMMDFSKDAVPSEQELLDVIGSPHELVIKKSVAIDDGIKPFISGPIWYEEMFFIYYFYVALLITSWRNISFTIRIACGKE